MCKGRIGIVVGIDLLHIFQCCIALGISRYINATGKASALGDEEHTAVISGTEFLHRLIDLKQMLVGKGLVHRDVVVSPRVMCGGTGFLSGSGTAGNAIHMNVATDKTVSQSWQHGQLDASGKASGIGQMIASADLVTMGLGQSVYIIMAGRSNAEVLCQVDNLHMLGYAVFLQESLALAMAKTEEHHIHLVKRHIGRKLHFCFTNEAFMHGINLVSGVGFAIGKDYLCLGMVQQHTDEFATRISCRT